MSLKNHKEVIKIAVFMEYEGIKGSATAKGYEGMIKLDHAQSDVKRTISMEVGNLKISFYPSCEKTDTLRK